MPKVKAAVKTLSDFKAEYDPDVRIPARIRAALAELAAEGKEHWEYDAEFISRCGERVGNTNIAAFREMFAPYQVKVRVKGKNDKVIWFGDPKVASKARGS